ncbi:hypothetical protein BDR07DRAFT_1497684 [Suillus spraguei]|nr:hypothetical protein BDR07DRAFT_1497684 [Suillus spraguei]
MEAEITESQKHRDTQKPETQVYSKRGNAQVRGNSLDMNLDWIWTWIGYGHGLDMDVDWIWTWMDMDWSGWSALPEPLFLEYLWKTSRKPPPEILQIPFRNFIRNHPEALWIISPYTPAIILSEGWFVDKLQCLVFVTTMQNWGLLKSPGFTWGCTGGSESQRGLASAHMLCPLPEYVPLISDEVQGGVMVKSGWSLDELLEQDSSIELQRTSG